MRRTLPLVLATSLLAGCPLYQTSSESKQAKVRSICDILISWKTEGKEFVEQVNKLVVHSYGTMDKVAIADVIRSFENTPSVGLRIRWIGAKYLEWVPQSGDGKEIDTLEKPALLNYLTDIYVFMVRYPHFKEGVKKDCVRRSA